MGGFSRVRAVAVSAAGALVASVLLAVAPTAAHADHDGDASVLISGTARVGKTLTAEASGWTGEPEPSYQWLANDTPISGATKSTLTLKAAQRGTRISVTASGSEHSATSTSTSLVASGVLKRATPKLVGKAAVGSRLRAKPGSWTKGTKFTYTWYAGGKRISGAKKSTLKLKSAQLGKRISVRVTGKKAGYTTVSKKSASTAKASKFAKPKIIGAKRVGMTVKVVPGTWTKGTKFSYQWYADGKKIKKGKKTTLKVTRSLAGRSLSVTVTGKKRGYTTVSKTVKLRLAGRTIEIDLSKQRLYLHRGGKVVSTYLVSTGKPGTRTHTGVYRIRAKLRLQNMGNPNLSLYPHYYTRNVPWVMYFNGNQAIHGAYWHNNFGHVMSHGCVNLPVKAAKRVYKWAKMGTTVWVHR
ncbi:MAG: L,D-transpeptidase family protein [Microbacterium sp.]|uniref:L,D-transpeptidase family protein n=1 Tax=Microbacterium sp. TaxID=51671 RepID=UPI0039E62AC3